MKLHTETQIVLIVAVIITVLISVIGIFSDVYMGDETYHFRMAKKIYDTQSRPIIDDSVNSTELAQRRFMVAPLWHAMLAAVWMVTGDVSQFWAQIYQSLWYFLLVILTYILGSKVENQRVGLMSAMVVATIPLFSVFSVVLYLDVFIATLTVAAFILLFEKQYVFLGIMMGLMFLGKRNSYLLFPFFFFCIFVFSEETWKGRFKNLMLFLVPFICLVVPDLWFRYYKIGSLIHHPAVFNKSLYNLPADFKVVFIHPGSWVHHPINLLKFLGVLFWVGFVLYSVKFYRCRKNYRERYLIWAIVTYVVLYLYLFKENLAVRYASPCIPLCCILCGKGYHAFIPSSGKLRWTLFGVVGGLQCLSALGDIWVNRRIPESVWQAYSFIKESSPEESRFMTIRPSLSLYTNRQSIWHSDASLPEIGYLFWKATPEETQKILECYHIDYLFVDADRITDEEQVHDTKNYPRSFVEKLATYHFLELVFQNESVSIWKVIP